MDITGDDINECFDIDNYVPLVINLSNSEIIDVVLNPHQSENNDEVDEEYLIEEKISNERCVELRRQLTCGMEQKSLVNETHIVAVYEMQELFLKKNKKQLKVDEMLN